MNSSKLSQCKAKTFWFKHWRKDWTWKINQKWRNRGRTLIKDWSHHTMFAKTLFELRVACLGLSPRSSVEEKRKLTCSKEEEIHSLLTQICLKTIKRSLRMTWTKMTARWSRPKTSFTKTQILRYSNQLNRYLSVWIRDLRRRMISPGRWWEDHTTAEILKI